MDIEGEARDRDALGGAYHQVFLKIRTDLCSTTRRNLLFTRRFSARRTWGSGRSPDTTASQPGGDDNEPLVPARPGWETMARNLPAVRKFRAFVYRGTVYRGTASALNIKLCLSSHGDFERGCFAASAMTSLPSSSYYRRVFRAGIQRARTWPGTDRTCSIWCRSRVRN